MREAHTKLERLTLIRPNMGNWRSSDALTPLALGILAARTPPDVAIAFYDDRLEEIPSDDTPDLMAITVETFTARRAYAIADAYRARGVPVVMGGYHPSALPEEALQHADAVVIGDAEGSWERLLADFRQGTMQKQYSGGSAASLDGMQIDRRIFAGKRYAPLELVQYARGCRFACDFCSIRSFYRDNVRVRPVDEVCAELKTLNSRRLIFFVDDNLFASRPQLEELLAAIKPLGLRWMCQISIDVARDDVLLDALADAGCMLVLIGFESLSSANLKQMGKPWNRVAGDYLNVVKRLHARGISVYGTFVFGYEHDTAQTIRDSLDFALRAQLDIANLNPLTPTPGSGLYERLERENRLLRPRWWLDADYRYGDPIYTLQSMPAEEMAQLCYESRKAFYGWRHIARRMLRSARSLDWFCCVMVGLANIISRREIMRKQFKNLGL